MPAPPPSLVITNARKVPNARKDALVWIVRMEDGAIYKFRSPQSVDLGKIRLAEANHLRLLLDTGAWKTSSVTAPPPTHASVPEGEDAPMKDAEEGGAEDAQDEMQEE